MRAKAAQLRQMHNSGRKYSVRRMQATKGTKAGQRPRQVRTMGVKVQVGAPSALQQENRELEGKKSRLKEARRARLAAR